MILTLVNGECLSISFLFDAEDATRLIEGVAIL